MLTAGGLFIGVMECWGIWILFKDFGKGVLI